MQPQRISVGRSGAHAIVDRDDYERVARFTWHISNGYALTNIRVEGGYRALSMHRLVMGCEYGDGLEVDHLNRRKLDNRKVNLRVGTHAENARNVASYRNSTSPYRAVCWAKKQRKWRARPRHDGRYYHLGYFHDDREAAVAVEAWRQAVDPNRPPDPRL